MKEKLLSKTLRPHNNSCWFWNGQCDNFYSYVCIDNKTIYAHRAFYELFVGAIPKDKQIDHLCRNRRCVNPQHLETVTVRENVSRGLVHLDRKHKLPLGVYNNNGDKFMAGKYFNGKLFWLGTYDTPEDANIVYETAVIF